MFAREMTARTAFVMAAGLLGAAGAASAGQMQVVSTSPASSALNQSVHTAIAVTFDRPVERTSVTATDRRFWAYGRWSGPVQGDYVFSDGDTTVTLVPDEPLFAGENVFVILSHDIQGADGANLRPAGYAFSFWTHARRAPLEFTQIAELNCRGRLNRSTRAYGGIASDLNNDGYSDLTLVQEDTADLRVFLNNADGSGAYDPFLEPTFPVALQASPSEPADFNADGNVDICVANIAVDTISVLLGNGDGTFAPQTQVAVGDAPRGIAVLDCDGDGDLDIVNTNSASSNLSLHENVGNGAFLPPTTFDAGGSSEWSLASADMNHDGIFDLVVGARGSQAMIVMLGNGDGTFNQSSSTFCGGRTWMAVIGDVNGDGHEDVATANSASNNGAILLGDGQGGLTLDQTYAVGSFPLATDLGDLDGDGDLDWTTSSFGAGEWELFTNGGDGFYATLDVIDAPAAGSCTLLHDFDNDGDNDITLIDELDDVALTFQNSGIAIDADFDGDRTVDLHDVQQYLACIGQQIPPDCEVFDADQDGDVDFADFRVVQLMFTVP